jgi:uncharacterized protein YycO
MEKITVVFTTRKWNPVSWLIRFCLPRSRFKNAEASHCLVKDGDYLIEASMTHGCRRALFDEALKGSVVVRTVEFEVQDAEAGLKYAREQVGKAYDFKGAFGLAIAPDRDWTEDNSWFCFELAAATLAKAGRDVFNNIGHITGNTLLALKPNI